MKLFEQKFKKRTKTLGGVTVMVGDSDSKKATNSADTPIPIPEGDRADWQSKIERAKEARKAGQELRKDKPKVFTTKFSGSP